MIETFVFSVGILTKIPLLKNHSLVSFSFLIFYSFFFWVRGREGEREGEIHQRVVAPLMLPTGDLAHNLGMCSDWELNRWHFDSQSRAQATEPRQPGLIPWFLKRRCGLSASVVAQLWSQQQQWHSPTMAGTSVWSVSWMQYLPGLQVLLTKKMQMELEDLWLWKIQQLP